MIVTPQSHLEVLRGIPWTNDYKHTRYFDTESQQNTYMSDITRRAFTFTDFTYIREQNVIRVPVCADDLYDCNYLRYMNNGFGSKWFYAFITDVKYLNPETSEISFELDEFQTWWFSADLDYCYVEREHVADDTIGRHIIDEDIGTGEIVPQVKFDRFWKYVADSDKSFEKGLDLMLQIKPTLLGDFLGTQSPFDLRDNQVVPATESFVKSLPYTDPSALTKTNINGALYDNTFTGAEVCGGFMYPYEIKTQVFVNIGDLATQYNIKRPTSYPYSRSIYDSQNPSYEPKNNKLLTYPYTYLMVVSSDGNKKNYRWENTAEGYLNFELIGSAYNTPSCLLKPANYLYSVDENLDGIPINEFPKVTLGQFEELKPQNLISGALGIIGSGISAVATGKPFGLISETAQAFTGLAMDTPDKDFATAGNSTLCKEEMIGYSFFVMGIHGQNAKVIDDYLTRFGYKVNCVKKPALHSRKRWNYVKCKECEISAKTNKGVPTGALKRMQDMFNAGITLWHVDDVGNFNGDNGIRS